MQCLFQASVLVAACMKALTGSQVSRLLSDQAQQEVLKHQAACLANLNEFRSSGLMSEISSDIEAIFLQPATAETQHQRGDQQQNQLDSEQQKVDEPHNQPGNDQESQPIFEQQNHPSDEQQNPESDEPQFQLDDEVLRPRIYSSRLKISQPSQDQHETLVQAVKIQRDDHNAQQRTAIIKWLSPEPHDARYYALRMTRLSNTGDWLFNQTIFQKWEAGVSRTLLITGIPGSGKTVLMSSVIEKLQIQHPYSPNPLVAVLFAFCSYERRETSIVREILLLLIQQATILQSQTPEAVELLYRRHVERRSVPTLEEVRVAFGESLLAFRKIYILIDGLDELANQLEPFLDVLGSLIKSFENLKILVASRPADSLMRHPIFHDGRISITTQSVNTDIQLFIRRELNSGQLGRLLANSNLQQRIEDNILYKADGMFLYAKLVIDQLKGMRSRRDVLKSLEAPPNNLHDLYSGIFKSFHTLNTTSRVLVECTLIWLVLSVLPVSVVEVEIAVPLLARNLHGLEDIDSFEIDTIVDNCRSLVVAYPDSRTIELVHASVYDWMQQKNSNLNLHAAQKEIGLVCINYISECALAPVSVDEQFRIFPLLSHAVKSWPYHAGKQESPSRVAEFLKMTRDFWLAALKHDGTIELKTASGKIEIEQLEDLEGKDLAVALELHNTAILEW